MARNELSLVRAKLKGDTTYDNEPDRRKTTRTYKIVGTTQTMQRFLAPYGDQGIGIFKEDGEVEILLKGDDRTFGSYKLTVTKGSEHSCILVSTLNPHFVPSEDPLVDGFASQVSKIFDFTTLEVKQFVADDKSLLDRLQKTREESSNLMGEAQVPIRFGDDRSLYNNEALRKLYKSNVVERSSIIFRHSAGLLDGVIRRASGPPNYFSICGDYDGEIVPDSMECVQIVLQQIWFMVDGSLDNLLSIIKAPEPLSTVFADDPSSSRLRLAARVRVVDKIAGKPFPVPCLTEYDGSWVWEQDDTVVMDLKPKTLLQFIDFCLRRDEGSSLETELIPTWTERWAQERKSESPNWGPWPYHEEPLTLFDVRFVEAVVLMISQSYLDPTGNLSYDAYDSKEVASFVHGVFHSLVEFDLGRDASA